MQGWSVGKAGWAMLICILTPLAVSAQTAEAPSTTEWVFRWLNFVLVFGVGGFYAGRWMLRAFRRKRDQIAASIALAETEQREAQERLLEAELKLSHVAGEAAEMRERGQRDSAAEVERLRAMAREEAARIERVADAEIAAAERAAVNRLREMAIELTLERARAAVADRLTPAAEASLFRRFVEALPGLVELS
jgi:F0F1-type ATP synthase membrane subunit b/b'